MARTWRRSITSPATQTADCGSLCEPPSIRYLPLDGVWPGGARRPFFPDQSVARCVALMRARRQGVPYVNTRPARLIQQAGPVRTCAVRRRAVEDVEVRVRRLAETDGSGRRRRSSRSWTAIRLEPSASGTRRAPTATRSMSIVLTSTATVSRTLPSTATVRHWVTGALGRPRGTPGGDAPDRQARSEASARTLSGAPGTGRTGDSESRACYPGATSAPGAGVAIRNCRCGRGAGFQGDETEFEPPSAERRATLIARLAGQRT